ncbi:Nuclear control of ATPase protein 2 [Nowakowskiella sp. JEL0078]|nr:Nuclear control of ATPase protein 2 [Nowakowskiella sp. JEL0078]
MDFLQIRFQDTHEAINTQFNLNLQNSAISSVACKHSDSWSVFSSLVFGHSEKTSSNIISSPSNSFNLPSPSPLILPLRAQILLKTLNSKALHPLNPPKTNLKLKSSHSLKSNFFDSKFDMLKDISSGGSLRETTQKLPTLSNLETILLACGPFKATDLQQADSVELSSVRLAEHLVIARSASGIHANLLRKILESSVSLPRDTLYLRSIEVSDFWTLYYMLHSLPSKVYKAIFNSVKVVRSEEKNSNVSHSSLLSFISLVLSRTLNLLRTPFIWKLRKDSGTMSSNDLHEREQVFALKMLLNGSPSSKLSESTLKKSWRSLKITLPSLFDNTRNDISARRIALERMRMALTFTLGLEAKRDLLFTSTNAEDSNSMSNALLKELNHLELVIDTLKNLTCFEALLDNSAIFENLENIEVKELNEIVNDEISFEVLHEKTLTLISKLRDFELSVQKLQHTYGSENFILRNWITISLTLIVFNRAISNFYLSFELYESWAKEALYAAKSFLEEWIWKPVKGIWETIRHKETKLALLGTESLNSDLEGKKKKSLERMVVLFAKDHGIVDKNGLQEVLRKAQSGDLTIVLEKYEDQMRSPISNIIKGDILRILLIQIQKAKVDGELAMTALDKLLRSNELNFAFLAMFPSILIVYLTCTWVTKAWNSRTHLNGSFASMRSSMREIDRLLNFAQTSSELNGNTHPYIHGQLLSEIYLLRIRARTVFRDPNQRSNFFEDIRDLENWKLSVLQKIGVLQRIIRFYPAIF